jgi:hypothetical protein
MDLERLGSQVVHVVQFIQRPGDGSQRCAEFQVRGLVGTHVLLEFGVVFRIDHTGVEQLVVPLRVQRDGAGEAYVRVVLALERRVLRAGVSDEEVPVEVVGDGYGLSR